MEECTDGGIPEQAKINRNRKYAAAKLFTAGRKLTSLSNEVSPSELRGGSDRLLRRLSMTSKLR